MKLRKKIFFFLCLLLIFFITYYTYIEFYSYLNIPPKILPNNFNNIEKIEPFYNK